MMALTLQATDVKALTLPTDVRYSPWAHCSIFGGAKASFSMMYHILICQRIDGISSDMLHEKRILGEFENRCEEVDVHHESDAFLGSGSDKLIIALVLLAVSTSTFAETSSQAVYEREMTEIEY